MYPDHGESVYLDTEIHSFRVSAREYGFDEIKDEIDLDFYDEILAFSLNWDNVLATDIKLYKQPDGSFPVLNTSLFVVPGLYYFCWKAPYIDYEGYVKASDSYWNVKDTPPLRHINETFIFNQKVERFTLGKEAGMNDEFRIYSGSTDWDPVNQHDKLEISGDRLYLSVWLPEVA